MRIKKDDVVALMIDIQYRLFTHIYEFEQLELNCARLINGLQTLEIPIHVTEQYVKGLGPTIQSLQEVLDEDYQPVEKLSFSCVDSNEYFAKLKESEKKTVILFGIETHVCVLQTAIDLKANGYNVFVVADCVSSRKESDKEYALERMKQEGVFICSYESILLEICRFAGSDTFKKVSSIIK